MASCAPDFGAVVDVVDTRTNKITSTRKIGEIGGILTGLTLSGDGDRAYLVSDDGVTVLCTLTHDVIGTVAVASSRRAWSKARTESTCTSPTTPARSPWHRSPRPSRWPSRPRRDGERRPAEWVMPELSPYEPALA